MAQTRHLQTERLTLGDAAVDGLIYGFAASLAMALVLVGAGLLTGESPAAVLTRFDPGGGSPWRGGLIHLAVGSVYGLGFGLLWMILARFRRAPLAGVALGVAYGLVLFVVAETLLLPGTGSALLAIPTWSMALAHLVYGLVIGLLLARRETGD